MEPTMSRRTLLTTGVLSGAAVSLASVLNPSLAGASPASVRLTDGPYGPLAAEPDVHGLLLPEGFSARIVATTGELVANSSYEWHEWPDGGACFATDDGGWVYVSNSERFPFVGGVGAVRFDADGEIVDAYSILEGTNMNCAGGPTPWGTWLSCEEFDLHDFPDLAEEAGINAGRVWECDPFNPSQGVVRPALGVFQHEAAAVDPVGERIYLTEDRADGLLYRFTPSGYPDLSEGLLEAALVEDGRITWVEVPDPAALEARPSDQLGDAVTQFNGGEGMWYYDGYVYFTTKGDDRVHGIEVDSDRYEVLYDPEVVGEGAPLRGVDNLTVEEGSGDIYVAEDGGDMEVVLLTADREMTPFLQLLGHDGSELTGPAFDPSGTRMYVSSQRGENGSGPGVTYEISGPFRGAAMRTGEAAAPSVTTTLRAAGQPAAPTGSGSSSDGVPTGALVGGGVVLAGAAAAGVLALRNRSKVDAGGGVGDRPEGTEGDR